MATDWLFCRDEVFYFRHPVVMTAKERRKVSRQREAFGQCPELAGRGLGIWLAPHAVLLR
jgi:hypothetical protein